MYPQITTLKLSSNRERILKLLEGPIWKFCLRNIVQFNYKWPFIYNCIKTPYMAHGLHSDISTSPTHVHDILSTLAGIYTCYIYLSLWIYNYIALYTKYRILYCNYINCVVISCVFSLPARINSFVVIRFKLLVCCLLYIPTSYIKLYCHTIYIYRSYMHGLICNCWKLAISIIRYYYFTHWGNHLFAFHI